MIHPGVLLKAHNLRASKRRGQNFLTQPATAQAIIGAAGLGPQDVVIEIGAGLGALSLAAASLVGRIIALEVDQGLFRVLGEMLAQEPQGNLEIRHQDALTLDWAAEARAAGGPLKVLGNLPYAISSPILFMLLDNLAHWRGATLMLQREVAQRLLAAPGSKEYGRLAVLMQTWCEIRPGLVVGPEQFFPRPRVESQVAHLSPRPEPLVPLANEAQAAWFSRVVKAAFSQRRKTLANSLAGGLGLERARVAEALAGAGMDPGRRAETLSPRELGGVARVLAGASF